MRYLTLFVFLLIGLMLMLPLEVYGQYQGYKGRKGYSGQRGYQGYDRKNAVTFDVSDPTAFIWPVKSQLITSKFGAYRSDHKRHTGIDIRAKNEDVYAVVNGVISMIRTYYQHGLIRYEITLKTNNGYLVIYNLLSRKNVRSGQQVKANETIGKSGGGYFYGRYQPHLHFEVHKLTNNRRWVAVDPAKFLKNIQYK